MKRVLLIGALSLAGVSLLPGSARSQDTVQRAGTVARAPSYESLLAALSATPAMTEKIANRTVTATDIRVIDVDDVLGTQSDEPIKAALDQHRDAIAALRQAVGANMAYTVALAGHREKPEAKDVIAVDILDSGDVLVYFRK